MNMTILSCQMFPFADMADTNAADVESNKSGVAAPPRVLIVISNLGFGGAERQVVEFVNSADPRQLDLQICSLSAEVPLAAQLHEPARLHILPKRGKYDLSVVPRLARLLRVQRIDVVHGFLFDAEIAAALAGRLAGVQAVVGSERNAMYSLSRVQRLTYRLTRGCFDRIVANSSAGAQFNRRELGHAPEKYRIVRNGVDVQRFRPMDRAAARMALGIRARASVVGMFASFKRQKNHALLLHAAQLVRPRCADLRLLFVGDTLAGNWDGSRDYADSVQALAGELGLRAVCMFLGNRTDLPELYSACDVTVLPSLFEGTPNAVLESMACGCPVIATDVADNAIVVPHRRVGLIVPLGDPSALAAAMLEVLGNPEWRTQLSSAAREWAESEFSLRALNVNMLQVYRELLS
jgi:glycosyltransferase involved in cell wall biosynthesis